MVAAKARAPRASAFSERHPGYRARSGRRISEGGKIGRKKIWKLMRGARKFTHAVSGHTCAPRKRQSRYFARTFFKYISRHHAHVPCWRLFSISSPCGQYETPEPTFVRTALDETGRWLLRLKSVSSSAGVYDDGDGLNDRWTSWYPLRGKRHGRRATKRTQRWRRLIMAWRRNSLGYWINFDVMKCGLVGYWVFFKFLFFYFIDISVQYTDLNKINNKLRMYCENHKINNQTLYTGMIYAKLTFSNWSF